MNRSLAPDIVTVLSGVALRCVECAACYPGIEEGRPPRYRCDCGGVLDVGRAFVSPIDLKSPAGTAWRQLFDERAAMPPTWPIKDDKALLDASGVWRYRELILAVPEQYVVSRPEGNTNLYAVGKE